MLRWSRVIVSLAVFAGLALSGGWTSALAAEPGSERSDPVQVGTEARVGDYSLAVLNVTPNADAIVADTNQFNDPPEEGRQFYIARVSIAYLGSDSGTPWSNLSFRSVGERNVGYSTSDDSCGVAPEGLSDTPELFEGGQVETNVCWSVESSDVDSLVMYVEPYTSRDDRVWFSLDPDPAVGSPAGETSAIPTSSASGKKTVEPMIELTAIDLAYEPKAFTIPADTDVTIAITNKGALQHDFHVDGLDVTTALLNSGGTDALTINLPAGTYEFWCTVPGHKEAGMVGTITVEGDDGSSTGSRTPEDHKATRTPAPEANAATSFELDTVDITFDPKELTIPANTDVTISVANKGVLQHDFAIESEGVESALLNGGDSTEVVVNLPPGTYKFICTVPGHKEAGMVGTLIVE